MGYWFRVFYVNTSTCPLQKYSFCIKKQSTTNQTSNIRNNKRTYALRIPNDLPKIDKIVTKMTIKQIGGNSSEQERITSCSIIDSCWIWLEGNKIITEKQGKL